MEFSCGNGLGIIGVGFMMFFREEFFVSIGEERREWEIFVLVGVIYVLVVWGGVSCVFSLYVDFRGKFLSLFVLCIWDLRLFWMVIDVVVIWVLRLFWSIRRRVFGDGLVSLERRCCVFIFILVMWLLLVVNCCGCWFSKEVRWCGFVSNWVYKGVVWFIFFNEVVIIFFRSVFLFKIGVLNWFKLVVFVLWC